MDIIDEKEFLRKNDIEANYRVLRVLICSILAGPLIALGTFLHIFETDYPFCLLITLVAFIEWAIDFKLCKKSEYFKLTKYFGLISVAILIGIMATQFSVGIYISYMFIPILSCMYLDSKLTRNISVFCYVVMIVALYFRAYGAIVRDFTHFTQKQWFISQGLGYTIEFSFSSLAICTLTSYLKEIIMRYYEESIDKITSSQTDKVKSAFFKNISVEIKETLDDVEKVTEEILLDQNLEDNIKEKVLMIADNNKLMRSKIRDISDFSRIDLTKKKSTVRKYHVTSLISEIEQAISSRIGSKNIDFNVVVNPCLPNELIGDKVRIRQVLINLLGDSVKFQEDGFIIVKFDYRYEVGMMLLCIEVMDNSYQRKLEDTEEMKSTLSICKALCEYMNGKIEISNDYDRGSGCSIVLPQIVADDAKQYGDVI